MDFFSRFGIINILWTNKAIKKDEEYFASYGYNVKTTDLPWYREAYKKFAADFPDQADPSALEAIRMIEEGKLAAAGGATMGEDTTKEGEEEEEKA